MWQKRASSRRAVCVKDGIHGLPAVAADLRFASRGLARVLLGKGGGPTVAVPGGRCTPLHAASQSGDLQLVEALLDHFPTDDKEKGDDLGRTALFPGLKIQPSRRGQLHGLTGGMTLSRGFGTVQHL